MKREAICKYGKINYSGKIHNTDKGSKGKTKSNENGLGKIRIKNLINMIKTAFLA